MESQAERGWRGHDARARPLGASIFKTTLVAEIATKSVCSSCRDVNTSTFTSLAHSPACHPRSNPTLTPQVRILTIFNRIGKTIFSHMLRSCFSIQCF